MIKNVVYKNAVYEDCFIDSETAVVTNSNGHIIAPNEHHGYYYVMIHGKGLPLHRIQGFTFLNLNEHPRYDVHHEDENPLNNNIKNLRVMSHKDHMSLHKKGCSYSDEIKETMSLAHQGQVSSFKGQHHNEETKEELRQQKLGCHWWNNGVEERLCKERPDDGWVEGRLESHKINTCGEKNPAFGRKWWTNGIIQIYCKDKPSDDFVNMTLRKYLKLKETI